MTHSAGDAWERIADVPQRATTVVITRGVEGGARLRFVARGPEGPVFSNLVFVIDLAQALRRHGRSDATRRQTQAFDLFADTGLAEGFVADLEALRAANLAPPRRTATGAAGAGLVSSAAAHVNHGNWEDYLDACAGRIGNSLLRFALGLSALPNDATAWSDAVRAAWDEDLPDDDLLGGLDTDQRGIRRQALYRSRKRPAQVGRSARAYASFLPGSEIWPRLVGTGREDELCPMRKSP